MKSNHLLRRLTLILVLIIIFGVSSFVILGKELWEAFYLTIIILLSHFEHGVENPVGIQVLTIMLVLGSYFVLAYIIKGAAEYIFGGTFKESRRKKKMAKVISKMKDHYIVCGYGRVGKQVAQELAYEDVDFIIVDRNPDRVKEAESKGYTIIEGDPIKESILKKAGVTDAKALISALGEDTDNLFLTLTARSMNADIFIVSRASSNENISKLKKAGANKVSLPYQIGGYHMAGVALRPAVVDFLDVISDGRHAELQIEEVNIERGSELVGQKIIDNFSREKVGITVLAVNKGDGTTRVNPSGDEIIERDDQLILMGTREQLEKISKETSK
jgi:voltage-gated potassium channel